jgi:predicted ATPase
VFRAAGAFIGGFDAAALEATAARAVGTDLNELLETSLVRRGVDGDRFELLELVRVFASSELAQTGDLEPARARHRVYFAEYVASASRAIDAGTSPGESAAPILADHANIRAALENAIEAGDEEPATALALGLRPLWFAGMLRQEEPGVGWSPARALRDTARARDRAAARGLVRGGLQSVRVGVDATAGGSCGGAR